METIFDDKYDDIKVAFPLGYLLDNCNDWDAFCDAAELNPWLLNDSVDTHPVTIAMLRKHGVLA